MFELDAFNLARLQFAFTVSFHILFPAITIGLASYLVVLEGMWLRTKDDVWRSLYNFWLKIFAVNFGMGVVSGLVMAYQFGTNWSGFSQFAGSITGPLLLYEVLTAFFLEAGFLGVMLLGWNKVPPGLHFFTTCMVALGTLMSTFWILASNSWMQTPQGFTIENGHIIPQDWLAIIFNPSFPYRLSHMAIAAFLSSAMFVGASAAWHLLRGNDTPAIRKMFSMAMWMALLVAPIQAMVGDMHGLNTLQHQPAKIAAIEGHWENKPGEATPLLLFGVPDMAEERTKYGLEIPALGSLILPYRLLVVSHHGGYGRADDCPRRLEPLAALSAASLSLPPLSVVRAGDGSSGTAGAVGRLDHDRSGTSALGHLWFFTHPGCGLPA